MRAKQETTPRRKTPPDQGLSYNEINKITGVSKSTLSSWLRDIPLTSEQEARLQARLMRNRATFAAHALPINREQYRRAREEAYQEGVKFFPSCPMISVLINVL